MTMTDWIQAISTLVLVGVTVVYAWRTHAISKATKEQADASVRMAEAIAKPALFPDFTGVALPKYGVIKFVNLGTGVALHGEIKVAYSAPNVVKRAWNDGTGQYGSMAGIKGTGAMWAILREGEHHSCQPELAECNPGNIGTAFAIYSDIYGRRFLSGQGYQCDKDDRNNVILRPTEVIYPLLKIKREE